MHSEMSLHFFLPHGISTEPPPFLLGLGFLREVEEWLREDAVKVELESLHSLGPNVLSTFLAESILQANYI